MEEGSNGGNMLTVELTYWQPKKAALGINTHTHTLIDSALPAYPVGWHMEWWGEGGCMPRDETEKIERSRDARWLRGSACLSHSR